VLDLDTARRLLDLGARLDNPARGEDQLRGAVALHNMLERRGVAYLADEVGMGKTYVALATVALFRHFQPGFRVLVIAPRQNIQEKWQKEWRNLTKDNVRVTDLRVRAADGSPARGFVQCENLPAFLREAATDCNRDFFLRMSSFSLAMADSPDSRRRFRNALRDAVPWLPDDLFRLNTSKSRVKDVFAQVVNAALPEFDLVVIDEAHSLRHGYRLHGAARNRVLAQVLGRPGVDVDDRLEQLYGPRARRVLLLSATPVEETYTDLWNQLDVVGRAEHFRGLVDPNASDDQRKAVAARVVIRRVNAIEVAGQRLTKNLYRREWHRGGCQVHDEPIAVTDDRQRLTVALMQKKVAELLDSERFGNRFQMGMLASFESFLETTTQRKASADPDQQRDEGVFDDALQTDDELERQGIDVRHVNAIARDYARRFGSELPHPKMDALVDALDGAWRSGHKSLMFVRRVASVDECKKKLDLRYDKWLIERMRHELPPDALERFDEADKNYQAERFRRRQPTEAPAGPEDPGGSDTFFAWFFRGQGPADVLSGAQVQQRFIRRTGGLATFFEINHAADLLDCRPDDVVQHLAKITGSSTQELTGGLEETATHFVTRASAAARGARFTAGQAAAIDLLAHHPGPWQEEARALWHELFEPQRNPEPGPRVPLVDALATSTFFSELRQRNELQELLWPRATSKDARDRVRETFIRAQLLASVARLGHAFIDLYLLIIQRIGSIAAGARQHQLDDERAGLAQIDAYLDMLEMQLRNNDREWCAIDELMSVAQQHEAIMRANLPDVADPRFPLTSVAKSLGTTLGRQQPIGGMSGGVNKTLVGQFRMPGYPLVLVTTDVLQEGEDLHLFCNEVVHYGISWTPSAMEQRTGRVDRVGSLTDRRLGSLSRAPRPDEKIQVYFPHLEDTVEVLQVRKVLRRMNDFLRLMHERIRTDSPDRKIDTNREMTVQMLPVPQIGTPLQSSFPVREADLSGQSRELAVTGGALEEWRARLDRLRFGQLPGLEVVWEEADLPNLALYGTVRLEHRVQPFALRLDSLGEHLLVHCVSPVGKASPSTRWTELARLIARKPVKVAAAPDGFDGSYDLTVEDDVLLIDADCDNSRVGSLIQRVVSHADNVELAMLKTDKELAEFRDTLGKDARHGR
jgi:hypothetical protein